MILVLATENKDKGKEIAAIIDGQLNLDLRLLSDYPNIMLPPETGTTYLQNATVKATYVASRSGQWALGDDSGLEVSALAGAPGLYSSRFAGEGASYADNRKKLLYALLDVPEEKRLARFVCTVAIADPNGGVESVVGVCEGRIACSETEDTAGFGYDPIFYPLAGVALSCNKTFAACTPAEKNQISHRGHAVRAAMAFLKKKFGV